MGFMQSYNWKKEFTQAFLIFLLGCVMSFAFNSHLLNRSAKVIAISMSYSGFMWLFFWKGNGYIVDFWNSRISWLQKPVKRFIVGFISVLIYTPSVLIVLNGIYNLFPNINIRLGGLDVIISVVITFLITFFLFAKEFLANWRKATIESERIKKEQMATKYESLKNQVNPHFLFNSLNALTNLVYEDQDRAADFIRKLSKVYRYVLDTRAQELVSIAEELKFVDSYLTLQKARFDDKLKVNIDLKEYQQRMIPPISLQILIENAIKHNVISDEDPLEINVSVEDERLVVKNNLQKKNIPVEESAGMGLPNIIARFEFLTDQKVEIIDGPEEFIVKLPLLQIEA